MTYTGKKNKGFLHFLFLFHFHVICFSSMFTSNFPSVILP